MNSLTEVLETQYTTNNIIEIAILTQDIELPKITDNRRYPLTYRILWKYFYHKEYKTAMNEYTNVIGAFYIPVLFPLIEKNVPKEVRFSAPSTNNIVNGSLSTSSYVERNFVSLTIPKYMTLQWKDKIPAGTKFLVAFVGGRPTVDNANIIGIYGQDL